MNAYGLAAKLLPAFWPGASVMAKSDRVTIERGRRHLAFFVREGREIVDSEVEHIIRTWKQTLEAEA